MNNAVIKGALSQFLPLAFNGLCFTMASLALFGYLKWRGLSFPKFGRDWIRILVLGFLGTTVYQALFIIGIHWTLSGNTSLILATVPIFVGLFSFIAGTERFHWSLWLGLLISLSGVSLIIFGGHATVGLDSQTVRGDLTILGAAVVTSFYLVACSSVLKKYGVLPTVTAITCAGTAFLVFLAIPSLAKQDWHFISLQSWTALFYSSFFGTALAYAIAYRLIQDKGSTRMSMVNNLVPVVGLLAAWVIVGEVPRIFQIVGAGAILFATFLASRSPKKFDTNLILRGAEIADVP